MDSSANSHAVLAVEKALSEVARRIILAKFRNGNLDGADVADILDILDNHDALLDLREPFYEDGAAEDVRQELHWSGEQPLQERVLAHSVLAVALLTGRAPERGEVLRLARRAIEGGAG